MTTQAYEEHIQALTTELLKLKSEGAEIPAAACVAGLDLTQNNSKMRTFASEMLKIDKRDFDRALRQKRIADELGSIPRTATEFVEIVANRRKLTVLLNGDMIDPTCPDIRFDYFQNELRVENDDRGLGFKREQINDASLLWHRKRREARLAAVREMTAYDPSTIEAAINDLTQLAETCFDDDPALVVAAILKFVHQVKRKMAALPISGHLMVILLGEQGGGKSTLGRKMFEIIKEATNDASVADLTDARSIDLFNAFVIFLDEMAKAHKADIETLKNVITAPSLKRRPLYTNAVVNVTQKATFLGTSNVSELQELVKDETGTRRFLCLHCKPKLVWDVVNGIDWRTIWRSVDENGADPMLAVLDLLHDRQEQQREKSLVEQWLDQLDLRMEFGSIIPGYRVEVRELHEKFQTYEKTAFPWSRMDVAVFGRQLSRAKDAPFRRAAKKGVWEYAGEPTWPKSSGKVVSLR